MKKFLHLILIFALVLLSVSCSSSGNNEAPKTPVEEEVETTVESGGDPVDTPTETPSQETEEVAVEEEDDPVDFQRGIPPEYRLKQNVTTNLDEPLPPPPEGAPESTFFSVMSSGGQAGGSNVDVSPLLTYEEIEKYFGMSLDKESSFVIASPNGNIMASYDFLPTEGVKYPPNFTVSYSSFATEGEAEEAYNIWGGEEMEEVLGKTSRMSSDWGVTRFTILTDKNEVIVIGGSLFEEQEETLLNYTKDFFKRFSDLSNQ